jgi:hypothetical protein
MADSPASLLGPANDDGETSPASTPASSQPGPVHMPTRSDAAIQAAYS